MNLRERILAVLHHKEPDFVPWVAYHEHMVPTGSLERELRNKGMALSRTLPVIWSETPNVRIESRVEGRTTYRTYHTPVGKVHSVATSTPRGIGRTTWTTEHMIKSVQDYDVVGFIAKDTIYHYDPEPFLEAQRWLEDDGIVRTGAPPSPLQQMLKNYLGFERLSVDMYRHQKEFNELYEIIEEKAEEAYRIVAESPAEVVCPWENIDGVVTNPRLFEKYCLPFYNKMGRILHQKGKIYLLHMDGRLNCLKNLISRADIDGVEAFTPPPVGDLPLREARALWGKRLIIWTNFPETVFLLGADETRRYTRGLLKSAAPGDNFIVGITEDIHPDYVEEGLRVVTETIARYGKYPVSHD